MRSGRGLAVAAAVLAVSAAAALAADVVVLKGGTVIELKGPVVRRGQTAYLTRTDGTLLSVPVSEIDRDATAAAKAASPAPVKAEPGASSTPAGAAAAKAKEGPKAKVRITDADVSHPLEYDATPDDKDKKKDEGAGNGRVEVADYTREKSGNNLVIKGTLRNPGQSPAENVRMNITAIDEKGQSIEATTANLSKGTVDPGTTVDFNASLAIGDKTVASLQFQPQWTLPKPPPTAGPRPGSAAAAAPAANRVPTPVPTPFGRGTLYAPPVANAPLEAPSDSHTGYIPGASSPDNQPKPPNR